MYPTKTIRAIQNLGATEICIARIEFRRLCRVGLTALHKKIKGMQTSETYKSYNGFERLVPAHLGRNLYATVFQKKVTTPGIKNSRN